jgi:hypothetical protein
MFFVDAGNDNIGIGTISPGNKLTVQQDISTSAFGDGQIRIQGAGDTNQFLSFKLATSANNAQIQAGDDSSGAEQNYALALNPSGGNVGIGTSSPQSTLHVDCVLRLEPQSSSPSGGKGDLYVDTNGILYVHDGTSWNAVAFA